ncbi:DUF1674 domain-containing protein [Dokdonella sp.]|uniref:DUF1674 domain-containing protein n=1 Tax=Dokdonella sp. TaxID=2291710 RepID=UPI003528F6A7
MSKPRPDPDAPTKSPAPVEPADRSRVEKMPEEIGGRDGPDPVRYGDWEKNGRCIDFRNRHPGL